MSSNDTHSKTLGYLLWIFGFFGCHRFYFGKPITGTLWFLTAGMFLIGLIIDLFLIPAMDEEADQSFEPGVIDYDIAWILLTFLGLFGIHRFYLGKFLTGALYFLTGGLFTLGFLYDLWTLNGQVAEVNLSNPRPQ